MKPEVPAAAQARSRELSDIPIGHYHRVMEEGNPVRRAWHRLKFTRALELCNVGPGPILDIGCFAGSLLSLADEEQFPVQLGVDILPEQVVFAQNSFGTLFRRFAHISSVAGLRSIDERFLYATCVEVIEHLEREEIRRLFIEAARLLAPGRGRFVLSTPNYASMWPLIELGLNHFSDVDYSEQHITRFRFFGFEKALTSIAPEIERYFTFEIKTTTHLLTPFMAALGVNVATRVGALVPHERWRLPFGNLVLVRLKRNKVEFSESRS